MTIIVFRLVSPYFRQLSSKSKYEKMINSLYEEITSVKALIYKKNSQLIMCDLRNLSRYLIVDMDSNLSFDFYRAWLLDSDGI